MKETSLLVLCATCQQRGEGSTRAVYWARGASGLEWFECDEHGELDNAAEDRRVRRVPLEVWVQSELRKQRCGSRVSFDPARRAAPSRARREPSRDLAPGHRATAFAPISAVRLEPAFGLYDSLGSELGPGTMEEAALLAALLQAVQAYARHQLMTVH